MAVPLLAAAKHLCKRSDWQLTHLKLQKLLYVAQMYHLWCFERPLVDCEFEAWEFGPVVSQLYQTLRVHGARPISGIPSAFELRSLPSGTEKDVLDSVMKHMGDCSGAELIEFTHWEHGAWKKNYVRGARHVIIPRKDMIEEGRKRHAEFTSQVAANE